jgi:phage shock protein E
MINLIILIAVIRMLFNSNIKLISSKKAKEMIKNNLIKNIIDVRTKKEWDKGHYPNAIHIPIEPIDKLTQENLKIFNKKDPILVYCRSGRRAKNAASKLKKYGFKKIYYINKTYKSLL